jgi:hypothetical protein
MINNSHIAAALFIILVVLHPTYAFEWKACGAGDFKITDVELAPEPVSPGSTVSFSITANAGIDVSSGRISMLVLYSGLPVWTQQDDLCTKTTCPLHKGSTVQASGWTACAMAAPQQ